MTDDAFATTVFDARAAPATLAPEQRSADEDIAAPAFGQFRALGFLHLIAHYCEEWAPPHDREQSDWLEQAMQSIQRLSGDDEGETRYNFHDESAAPSVSEARTECFAEGIWGASTTCVCCSAVWARA